MVSATPDWRGSQSSGAKSARPPASGPQQTITAGPVHEAKNVKDRVGSRRMAMPSARSGERYTPAAWKVTAPGPGGGAVVPVGGRVVDVLVPACVVVGDVVVVPGFVVVVVGPGVVDPLGLGLGLGPSVVEGPAVAVTEGLALGLSSELREGGGTTTC